MRRTVGLPLCGAMLALLVATACDRQPTPAPSPPPPVASVSTVALSTGKVEESLETLGRVEVDPKRTRTVAFATSGQVRQVLVAPGQSVDQGAELLTLGPLPGDSFEVQQARLDLDFAHRELERLQRMRDSRLATNGQVQQAEKNVSSAKAALQSMGGSEQDGPARVTRAPFAGIVRDVLVTAGAIAHAGEPAMELAPGDGVVVRCGFEPEDLAGLQVGETAIVEPVLQSDGGAAVSGSLAALHRVVDPDTQLLEAVVHSASVPAWMIPGAIVRVRIAIRSAADVVLVPREALLSRDGARGVFVVDGGVAHWTPVETGVEGPSYVEARSGVAAGARVATTGRSVLRDEMRVLDTGAGPST